MLGIVGVAVDAVTVGIDLSRDARAFDVITPKGEDLETILSRGKA